MDITYTFKKTKVLTDPGITSHQNVISRVYWMITFSDGTSDSIASGVTDLNTSNIENFVEIGDITDNMLGSWVIAAQGGDAFINMLLGIHGPIIAKKTEESKLEVYFSDATTTAFGRPF